MLLYLRRIVKDARRPLGAFYSSHAEISFQNQTEHSQIIRHLSTFQIRRNRFCRKRLVSSWHLLYSLTPFSLIKFIGTVWGRRGSRNGVKSRSSSPSPPHLAGRRFLVSFGRKLVYTKRERPSEMWLLVIYKCFEWNRPRLVTLFSYVPVAYLYFIHAFGNGRRSYASEAIAKRTVRSAIDITWTSCNHVMPCCIAYSLLRELRQHFAGYKYLQ
jgi:hypothetical protein